MLVSFVVTLGACGGGGGNSTYDSIDALVKDANSSAELCRDFKAGSNDDDLILPTSKATGDCLDDEAGVTVTLYDDEATTDKAADLLLRAACGMGAELEMARGANWIVFDSESGTVDANAFAKAADGRVVTSDC